MAITRKRITVIYILLFHALSCHAKQDRVWGTVTNENEKPIANCLIQAVNSNYFTYSNDQGKFSLEYNGDSSKSLIFLCLGYESKEVTVWDDTLRVVLRRKLNKLNDVVISAENKTGKIKQGVLGKKNLKQCYGILTGNIGNEWAIFLQADPKRPGELQNLYFYIVKDGIPDSRFRVHVYNIDTNYMPGTDLLDSIVILHANEGDEWVSVDVSSRHIPVGRSVFVSMEWIVGYGNNEALVTSKEFTAQAPFNGQVLGLTDGYHAQGSIAYVRKDANSPWSYIGLHGYKFFRNPMIYATYLYHKR